MVNRVTQKYTIHYTRHTVHLFEFAIRKMYVYVLGPPSSDCLIHCTSPHPKLLRGQHVGNDHESIASVALDLALGHDYRSHARYRHCTGRSLQG